MLIAAIALFLLLCFGSEYWFSRKLGLRIYAWRESVSHLSLMLGQQIMNVYTMALLSVIYLAVYNSGHLFTFDTTSLLHWGCALLLSDLAFYFAHRLGHRMNFFVAFHGVHHQAKDYNHISASRQSWVTRPIMFAFYLPLAAVGVPASMLFSALLINLIVQFWSHNGVIRCHLGLLEYVLITPRAHRVHHGTNAPYLDRNFGGAFIFWDRIFGTYQDVVDTNPVQIGWDRKALHLDPLRTQWDYLHALRFATKKRKSLLQKLTLWIATPETLAKELEKHGYEGQPLSAAKRVSARQRKRLYAKSALYFGLIFASTVLLVLFYAQMGLIEKGAMALSSFLLMGLFGNTFSQVALPATAREQRELDENHARVLASPKRRGLVRGKVLKTGAKWTSGRVSKTPSRTSRSLPRSSREPAPGARKAKPASKSSR